MSEISPQRLEGEVPAPVASSPNKVPEDAAKRLRTALGFNVVFAEEFKILRPYLGRTSLNWPVKIQEMIIDNEELNGKFSSADKIELKEARHGRVVVAALRCLLKIMTLTIQILNRASFTQLEKSASDLAPF